jgi:hypothetical protein
MAPLPPLPPGASLVPPPAPRRDPLDILKAEGFEWTNGYRTPADTQRIREQGYKPAANSLHLDADAVDLRHPKLSPAQQATWLNEHSGNGRPKFGKVVRPGPNRLTIQRPLFPWSSRAESASPSLRRAAELLSVST